MFSPEERALKRKRRIRKKLQVGEFEVVTYLIRAKSKPCENDEDYFDRFDEVYKAFLKISGDADIFISKMADDSYDTVLIHVNLPISACAENIVEVARNIPWLLKPIDVTKPKNAFYDPIWDTPDDGNLDGWEIMTTILDN